MEILPFYEGFFDDVGMKKNKSGYYVLSPIEAYFLFSRAPEDLPKPCKLALGKQYRVARRDTDKCNVLVRPRVKSEKLSFLLQAPKQSSFSIDATTVVLQEGTAYVPSQRVTNGRRDCLVLSVQPAKQSSPRE